MSLKGYGVARAKELSSRIATAVLLAASVISLPDWLTISAVLVSAVVAGTPDDKLLMLLGMRK